MNQSKKHTNQSTDEFEVFLLRTDLDKNIVYVNSLFCTYVNTEKALLLKNNISFLESKLHPDIYRALDKMPVSEVPVLSNVSDGNKNTFEIRSSLNDLYVDITIQNLTKLNVQNEELSYFSGSEISKLSEKDFETIKYPERRFMTVSHTSISGLIQLSESKRLDETRICLNAFLEDLNSSVSKYNGVIDKVNDSSVLSLFGAPVYYKNHSLRALLSACDQIKSLGALQRSFYKIGLHTPNCSIVINTGDIIVGNINSLDSKSYTAFGSALSESSKICEHLKEGQVAMTEETLKTLLMELPKDWEFNEVKNIDDKYFQIEISHSNIAKLDDRSKRKVIYIGPKVKKDIKNAKFSLQYLFNWLPGEEYEKIPIILVRDLRGVDANIKLDSSLSTTIEKERLFGKYRLISLLGKGGMGEVWKAVDGFGNLFAIKTMNAGEFASPIQLKRFQRESKLMSKLKHDGICKVFEVGKANRASYLAMEYIEGVNLHDLLYFKSSNRKDYLKKIDGVDIIKQLGHEVQKIEKNKLKKKRSDHAAILPKDMILFIIKKICNAIDFAHRNNITHRDIKPANIMIRRSGDPVIMDFGLAKNQNKDELNLTVSGEFMGTIDYMAPEQTNLTNDSAERADIYSIGAILYEMLTGEKHFISSGNILSDIKKLDQHEPERLIKKNPQIDSELEVITLKSLSRDPNERYQSIDEFYADIRNYEHGLPISAKKIGLIEVSFKWYKRNRPATTLAVLFIFILMGITAGFIQQLIIEKDIANQSREEAIESKRVAIEASEKSFKSEKAATQALNDLKKVSVKAAPKYLLEAKAKILEGKIEEAMTLLNIAIELNDKFQEAYILKFKILLAQKSYKSSNTLLELMKTHIINNSNKSMLSKFKINNQMMTSTQIKELKEWYLKDENYELLNLMGQSEQDKFLDWNTRVKKAYGDIALKKYTKRGLTLSLNHMKNHDKEKVRNLSPLSGIPINSLYAGVMPIENITALKGMPLKLLVIKKTKVTDLEPLRFSPLELLDISNNNIYDISPLKDTKLKILNLEFTKVDEISALSNLPLEDLNISRTKILNLEPVSKAPLKIFWMNNTDISSILPISNCPIEEIYARSSDLKSLEGFQKLNSLTILDLSRTPVQNIEQLQGLKIERLYLGGTSIVNFSILKSLPLKELILDKTKISDIGVLENLPLIKLSLSDTNITKLNAIESLPFLKQLNISNTKVDSLNPLNKVLGHLEYLNIKDSDVVDISTLKNSNLKKLVISPNKLKNNWREILLGLKSLKILITTEWEKAQSPQEFFIKFDQGFYEDKSD